MALNMIISTNKKGISLFSQEAAKLNESTLVPKIRFLQVFYGSCFKSNKD